MISCDIRFIQQKIFNDLSIDPVDGLSDLGAYSVFSDFHAAETVGAAPLPILTAVHGDYDINEAKWVEFTPFGVDTCRPPGGAILPALFGLSKAQYDKVKSKPADFRPIMNSYDRRHFLAGFMGAAFAAPADQILGYAPDYIRLPVEQVLDDLRNSPKIVRFLLKKLGLIDLAADAQESYKQLTSANVPHQFSSIPDLQLNLRDAGTAFNLPLPPLLARKQKLIVIFEASVNIWQAPSELIKARDWAAHNGVPFPQLPANLKQRVDAFKAKFQQIGSKTGTELANHMKPVLSELYFTGSTIDCPAILYGICVPARSSLCLLFHSFLFSILPSILFIFLLLSSSLLFFSFVVCSFRCGTCKLLFLLPIPDV